MIVVAILIRGHDQQLLLRLLHYRTKRKRERERERKRKRKKQEKEKYLVK